jgi:hypothetical protein
MQEKRGRASNSAKSIAANLPEMPAPAGELSRVEHNGDTTTLALRRFSALPESRTTHRDLTAE